MEATKTKVKHPARYSDSILEVIAGFVFPWDLLLDPFAGTGRIHELDAITIGVEIEPEWASMHPDTVVGDALALPFADESFDIVCTSPCYGNRFADHHNAKDPSKRRSYKFDLGRELHPNSAGTLQWGEHYRTFHTKAWKEVSRVTRPGGRFILNVSDHIRNKQVQHVAQWHLNEVKLHGFTLVTSVEVPTPRLRHGENHEARVDHELVAVFTKAQPE